MSNCSVFQVPINKEEHYLISLQWEDSGVQVMLMDFAALKAWKGNHSEENWKHVATALEMDLEQYKSELKIVFNPSSSSNYEWSFLNGKLYIKKIAAQIFYKLVTIILTEITIQECLPEFMPVVAQTLKQSNLSLCKKDDEIKQLEKERSMLMERCEKYLKMSEELTPLLYARFATAFNSLKERFNKQVDTPTPTTFEWRQTPSPKKTPQKRPRKPSNEKSDSSYNEETDVDTDDDRSTL